MMVVDASAVVDALLDQRVLPGQLVAPSHLAVEVTSALARLERSRVLSSTDADQAIALLTELAVTSVSTQRLLPVAWRLRGAISIADSFYVACALVTSATLLTHDRRLARAAHAVGVEIVGQP